MTRKYALSLVVLAALAAASLAPAALPAGTTITTSTYVGGKDDGVMGAAVQADGTIVMAANISSGPWAKAAETKKELIRGKGCVMRLSPDGRKVLSLVSIGPEVRDLAIDGKGRIVVACGAGGLVVLGADGTSLLGRRDLGGVIGRVDAGADGTIVALQFDNDSRSTPGRGTIHLFNAKGQPVGKFRGHRHTLDVCVDDKSKTVVHIGWRQARAYDGKRNYPVQIAYVRGVGYDGKVKYLLYDWSTDRKDPRFLNKMTNNMADTRGYRCTIGEDGKLYCGFEAAGGNHIFRWEPILATGDKWVNAGGKKVKGDKYHEWFNSRSEHKTFFGRYEPATGAYVQGQQFAGRLGSGRTNAVRMVDGAIFADASGRVYLGGSSASGLPLSYVPKGTGDYTGGAYLLIMDKTFRRRLLCTRLQPGGQTRCIAARTVKDKTIIVVGGTLSTKTAGELFVKDALQTTGQPGGGFFAVFQAASPRSGS